jgi:transcriptional regulator with XRE-family HTH domain
VDHDIVIGRKLRERRLARGLTQHQLANAVGVSQSFIAQIESGKRPTPERLRKSLDENVFYGRMTERRRARYAALSR